MDNSIYPLVDDFFQSYPRKKYETGTLLARPGSEFPGILYIEKGEVVQYDIADDGRQIIVNSFKKPAFFPMSWAINHSENQYYFEVKDALSTRCAPPEDVVEFLKSNPDILLDLMGRVYRGTDGLLRRLAHSFGGRASTVLMFELISYCRRFGNLLAPDTYALSVTGQELAARTGLSRETVSRELQHLKNKSLVELEYRKIIILDLKELEHVLGSRL